MVYKAWVHACDNYLFVTSLSNETIFRYYNLTHPKQMAHSLKYTGLEIVTSNGLQVFHPPNQQVEMYDKLTDKVYLAFRHVFDVYIDDFDWFLKGNLAFLF